MFCGLETAVEQNIKFRAPEERSPGFHRDVYHVTRGSGNRENKIIISRCHELRRKHHDLRTATRGPFLQSKS